MTTISEILSMARETGHFVLTRRLNQYGDRVGDDLLVYRDGEFHHGSIACLSSAEYGLGTCQCNSHPSYNETKISLERAVELAREYLDRLEPLEEKRLARKAALDPLIEELRARGL